MSPGDWKWLQDYIDTLSNRGDESVLTRARLWFSKHWGFLVLLIVAILVTFACCQFGVPFYIDHIGGSSTCAPGVVAAGC